MPSESAHTSPGKLSAPPQKPSDEPPTSSHRPSDCMATWSALGPPARNLAHVTCAHMTDMLQRRRRVPTEPCAASRDPGPKRETEIPRGVAMSNITCQQLNPVMRHAACARPQPGSCRTSHTSHSRPVPAATYVRVGRRLPSSPMSPIEGNNDAEIAGLAEHASGL